MKMKILHAADLHLDSRFAGLPPEKAAIKRAQQRQTVCRLSEYCRDTGCQLLFLAGDLFDGEHIYRDTVDDLTDALASCGAEVFIAPGNHDCLLPGSPYLTERWPENVHIFTSEQIQCVTLEALGCRVYGAGFRSVHPASLLEGFRAAQDGLCNLMVLHGEAGNPASTYNPVTAAQIEASGLDYLALGHIHAAGQLRAGKTLCAWPGCLMGRGFDETGEKGALEVTVSSEGCETRFVPMGAGSYSILTVNAEEDPLTAIRAAVPSGTENDTYRIILRGECEPPELSALYDALSPDFFGLELQDKTVPPLDLWRAAGEDTLKGVYLRMLKERYDAAPEEERAVIADAARTGLALMEQREVPAL